MYLVGAPHPHTVDAQRWMERLLSDRQRLVTDAEVLQEILHRYVAVNRRDAIQPAFDSLLGVVVDEVLAVDRAMVERAPGDCLWSWAPLRARRRASRRDGTTWHRTDPDLRFRL